MTTIESAEGHAGNIQTPPAATASTPASGWEAYIDAVASDAPTPGGGSVAAIVGALAAALGEMVCNLTIGRPKFAASEARIVAARERLRSARTDLLTFSAEDEAAYGGYRSAVALPKVTTAEQERRQKAMQDALLLSARVPIEAAGRCLEIQHAARTVAACGNPQVRSDALIANILAEAAVRACAVNVRANTAFIRDRSLAAGLERQADEHVGQAAAITAELDASSDR